jgi:hypothetical protein
VRRKAGRDQDSLRADLRILSRNTGADREDGRGLGKILPATVPKELPLLPSVPTTIRSIPHSAMRRERTVRITGPDGAHTGDLQVTRSGNHKLSLRCAHAIPGRFRGTRLDTWMIRSSASWRRAIGIA